MPRPHAGGQPLVGCLRHIRSYLPYLEAVSSVRNLRTRHAVVTWDPLNMAIITTTVRNRTAQFEFKELHSSVNISFHIGLTCQISSTIGGRWGTIHLLSWVPMQQNSFLYSGDRDSIDWAQLSRFYLETETESSLRNVVFLNK
jgi:hypothetical protein